MQNQSTRLFLTAALVGLLAPRASAQSGFIPAANRTDTLYDQRRGLVYISNGASLLRYDINKKMFLTPYALGGSLYGMDISPDGSRLVVADSSSTANQVWVDEINLNTGAAKKDYFDRAFYEGGTYSVAFGKDGSLLTTSTFQGSGWVPLRRYDPATGQSVTLDSVRQDSMLAASADRSVIGFEESNISDGRFGRYRVSDGDILKKQWYQDGTSWFNYEIATNRNGTQYALPTYGGTFITDKNLVKGPVIGQYAGGQPIGAAYSPVSDVVYFAWAGTNEVRAYDTNSFLLLNTFHFNSAFASNGNFAFVNGRLRVSDDGTLLLATINGGVQYMRIPVAVPEPGLIGISGGLLSLACGGIVRRRRSRHVTQ